jgi:hypothetical protein
MNVQPQKRAFRPSRTRSSDGEVAAAVLLVVVGSIFVFNLRPSPPRPVLSTTIEAHAVANGDGAVEEVTIHTVNTNGESGPLSIWLDRADRDVEIASVTSPTCHLSTDRLAAECPALGLGDSVDVTLTYQRPRTGVDVAVYFDADGSGVATNQSRFHEATLAF